MNENVETLIGTLTPCRVRAELRSRVLAAVAKELQQHDGSSGSGAGGIAPVFSSDNLASPVGTADLSTDPISIIVRPSNVAPSPLQHLPLINYFTQVGPFSYLVSALAMCIAVLAAWQYKMTDRPYRVEFVNRPSVSPDISDSVCVGHVTGADECQWGHVASAKEGRAKRNTPITISSPVSAGRQIALDSGLLEITFRSGAQVLLQGPAVFDVGDNGGFLTIGKLTGRLDKPSRQSLIPNATSPFVIQTPTAAVTDQGTEFGVEVDEDGGTTSVVFRGAVAVQTSTSVNRTGELVLHANEAARVGADLGNALTISRTNVAANYFTRNIKRGERGPIHVFGTGLGLRKGDRDPWWQVVAATGDPAFKPEPALVAPIRHYWGWNSPRGSQWVSTTLGPKNLSPRGATYTFSTSFDLSELLSDTAVLKGWCMVDDELIDIRLNGRSVAPAKNVYDATSYGCSLTLDEGFVEGINALEVEVRVGEPKESNSYNISPLGLRMELSGTASWKP